jgi:hypothetical protein
LGIVAVTGVTSAVSSLAVVVVSEKGEGMLSDVSGEGSGDAISIG